MIAEKFEHAGLVVGIHYDEDVVNPRTDWDHAGTMLCWHRRCNLGDEQLPSYVGDRATSTRFIARWLGLCRDAAVILPLGLIEHSGLSMWVGSGAHICDPGGWDSGQVGFIFCTGEELQREWGGDREAAERYLRASVEEYDSYLRGECYGFVVETPAGDELDSCWGFLGDAEYCIAQAKESAEHHAQAETSDAGWAAQRGIPTVSA